MNSSSYSHYSVNSDIAIQWEWSYCDPSQNPNPLTDYDKTLYNWLCPRVEHVTQNVCQSAVRERLVKYMKCKASIFSPDSPTEVTSAWNFTHDGSKHTLWRKEVPFGVHTMADNIFGFKLPQNRQKWPSISMFERPRTQDEWCHRRLMSLACSAAELRILFIASWKLLRLCILQYLQRNDSVSWCTIFGTEIQFLQNLYSICRQSVLQVGA